MFVDPPPPPSPRRRFYLLQALPSHLIMSFQFSLRFFLYYFFSGAGAGADPLRQGGLQAPRLDGAVELDTTVGENIR